MGPLAPAAAPHPCSLANDIGTQPRQRTLASWPRGSALSGAGNPSRDRTPVRQGSCPGRVPSGGRRVPAPSHCSPGRDCHSVGSGGLRSRGGSTAGTRRAQGSPRRGIDRSRRAWSTGLHEPITLFCTSGPASMASIASRNSPTPTSRAHGTRRLSSRALIERDETGPVPANRRTRGLGTVGRNPLPPGHLRDCKKSSRAVPCPHRGRKEPRSERRDISACSPA